MVASCYCALITKGFSSLRPEHWAWFSPSSQRRITLTGLSPLSRPQSWAYSSIDASPTGRRLGLLTTREGHFEVLRDHFVVIPSNSFPCSHRGFHSFDPFQRFASLGAVQGSVWFQCCSGLFRLLIGLPTLSSDWVEFPTGIGSTAPSLDDLLSLLHQKLLGLSWVSGTDLIWAIPIKGRPERTFSARTSSLQTKISQRFPPTWV